MKKLIYVDEIDFLEAVVAATKVEDSNYYHQHTKDGEHDISR